MESIKSQHNDEIELLQSILYDTLHITQTEPFHKLEIEVKADITENPFYKCILSIELTENYPSTQIFNYTTAEKNNKIISSKFKEIHAKINELFNENIGSPIIFQAVELLKEFLNDLEQKNTENEIKITNEIKVAESKLLSLNNNSLLETKKYTPVNKANYEVWFKKYIRDLEKENEQESKRKKELMSRCTGRQYFMDLKGKDKKLDEEQQEDDEEDVDFDEFKKKNIPDKKEKINNTEINKQNKINNGMLKEDESDEVEDDQEDEDFDPDMFDEDIDIDNIDFDN